MRKSVTALAVAFRKGLTIRNFVRLSRQTMRNLNPFFEVGYGPRRSTYSCWKGRLVFICWPIGGRRVWFGAFVVLQTSQFFIICRTWVAIPGQKNHCLNRYIVLLAPPCDACGGLWAFWMSSSVSVDGIQILHGFWVRSSSNGSTFLYMIPSLTFKSGILEQFCWMVSIRSVYSWLVNWLSFRSTVSNDTISSLERALTSKALERVSGTTFATPFLCSILKRYPWSFKLHLARRPDNSFCSMSHFSDAWSVMTVKSCISMNGRNFAMLTIAARHSNSVML